MITPEVIKAYLLFATLGIAGFIIILRKIKG
jgi:hypothetical protein